MASVISVPVGTRLLGPVGSLPALIGVGTAYYLGAEVAFLIGTASDKMFAPFWPPNVILFCALVFTPPPRWWLMIAAVFPAHVIAELNVGMRTEPLLIAFATNCLLAVLNAISVRWLLGGPPWFGTVQKAVAYIVATASINPAIAAFGGAFVPIVGGGQWGDYWLCWSAWYLGNALGALTLGPIILTWTDAGRGDLPRKTTLRRALEAALLAVALVVVCLASLELNESLSGGPFVTVVLFLPLPIILWSSLRFGEKGGSGGILVLTVVSIWNALNGPSPFLVGSPEVSVLTLQLFLIGIAVPALLLSATVHELQHAATVARALVASLLRAQDDERRRIARDIHDTTAQNLIAAGLLVDSVATDAEAARAKVGTVKDLINQSVRELQTVSYLLHPPLLDHGGLGEALPPYIRGFSERSRVAVALRMRSDFPRQPIDIELVIYRVVQEALSNIARHSCSKTAEVEIVHHGAGSQTKVHLGVTDFGTGISSPMADPGAHLRPDGAGIGLDSMRERVDQVGGQLRVRSVPGKTSVTAVIPVGE